MTEPQLAEHVPFPVYLFRFTGRIRPAQHFIGIAFASLIATFGLAVSAMAPTGGGGGALLAIPMFALFIWIVVAVMVQRLRTRAASAVVSRARADRICRDPDGPDVRRDPSRTGLHAAEIKQRASRGLTVLFVMEAGAAICNYKMMGDQIHS
jgi:hypothetical protein